MKTRPFPLASLAFAVLALTASAARADDEGKLSLGFMSSTGLTGMREMIDARVPEVISVRGVARFEHDSLNVESDFARHAKDVYAGELIAGGSLLGAIDAGVRLPFQYRVNTDRNAGLPTKRRSIEGTSDPIWSGKGSFRLGPVAIAPYGSAQVAIGKESLEHANHWDLGLAGSASLLNERIAVHANITWVKTFVHFGPGKFAFGYRLGASVVPWADEFLVLRLYGYADGLEYGGSPGSDVRVAFGAQALLFRIFVAEVGGYGKIIAGDLPTFAKDEGTYGINFSLGVSLTF